MTGREIEERLAQLETKMQLIVWTGGALVTGLITFGVLVLVGVIR